MLVLQRMRYQSSKKRHHVIFPDYLKAFLLTYGGTKIQENKYLTQYTVSGFLPLPETGTPPSR